MDASDLIKAVDKRNKARETFGRCLIAYCAHDWFLDTYFLRNGGHRLNKPEKGEKIADETYGIVGGLHINENEGLPLTPDRPETRHDIRGILRVVNSIRNFGNGEIRLTPARFLHLCALCTAFAVANEEDATAADLQVEGLGRIRWSQRTEEVIIELEA